MADSMDTNKTTCYQGHEEGLAERGQLDQIAFRNLLGGLAGFAPRRQSADDDKGAKALFS